MTTFIVNGQEHEVTYTYNGIDISADFIGNTTHGMDTDDEGNYLASQEDFDWWVDMIKQFETLDTLLEQYRQVYGADAVDQVIRDYADVDMENQPAQIRVGLEELGTL